MAFFIIGLCALPWFTVPFFTGIHNIGNLAGTVLFSGFILYGILKIKHILPEKNKIYQKIKTAVASLLCLCFLFAGVESAFMLNATLHAPPTQGCTLIVLGCKVNGSAPSKMLRSRITAAVDYMKQSPDTYCIVSGGQGTDENISEAQCMYNEMVKAGIDKERIYRETQSTSTRENLRFAAEIINKEGLSQSVILVTNEFHQYRATLTAKEMGLTPYAVSASTEIGLLPTYWFREFFGILAEWAI